MKVKAFLIYSGVYKKIEINKDTIFFKDHIGHKGFCTFINDEEFFISSESLSRAGITEKSLWHMDTSSNWIYAGAYIEPNRQITFKTIGSKLNKTY